MREVTYGAAVSLDGYIAGPGETIDWLRWSDDAAAIAAESFKGVDTMLMGRKTFEFAERMGGGPVPAGVKTYVFSRTLERLPDNEAAELVREDAAKVVRRWKEEPGGGILVMGGGELGSALIEAGVVDEVGLSVHPVLLDGGTPMFGPMAHRAALELIEARTIKHGCLFLRYRAAKEAK